MKAGRISSTSDGYDMPSAFGLIGNPALQEHWFRRFLAFVIDAIIVVLIYLVLAIPGNLLAWNFWLSSSLAGFIWFLYSLPFETFFGGTVGKKVFALRVVAIDRNLDFGHALVRNIPKILWPVLFFDLFIGAATAGDPRQRLFDRIAGTTVTRVDQGAYMEEQFRMMQHAMPHPMTVPPAAQAPPQPPGTQAPPGGWPGQPPTPPSSWPQHQWDSEGRLVKEMKFCTACGGQLVARGDGKLTCVRCGTTY
jgi:uncharacterized RDD family membrane protein YckC/ribosomal protein S27AE